MNLKRVLQATTGEDFAAIPLTRAGHGLMLRLTIRDRPVSL